MQRTVHVPGLCGLQALYVVYDPYLSPFRTVIPANNEEACVDSDEIRGGGLKSGAKHSLICRLDKY